MLQNCQGDWIRTSIGQGFQFRHPLNLLAGNAPTSGRCITMRKSFYKNRQADLLLWQAKDLGPRSGCAF